MDQHETHVSKDVIMYCRENKIEILCLPIYPHHTHPSAPGYCCLQLTEDCFFSTIASRMSLAREDLVVGKKQFSPRLIFLPHCCHSPKCQGWVPQGWNLSSFEGCCGHNPGHFTINTMLIHPLSYLHFFSSVLMGFTCILLS